MKYATINASITTGNSDSAGICITEHPRIALDCATFAVETASVGLQIYGSDTLTGTYRLLYTERANLSVPVEYTAFVGGGTVIVNDELGPVNYIKAHLKANTATAVCSVRVICRTD